VKDITIEQVLYIHEQVIAAFGGDPTIRDRARVEAAVAQPRMAFGGASLYPTLAENKRPRSGFRSSRAIPSWTETNARESWPFSRFSPATDMGCDPRSMSQNRSFSESQAARVIATNSPIGFVEI
jgi:hypothetical protein